MPPKSLTMTVHFDGPVDPEEVEDILANALWEYGYGGSLSDAETGNETVIRSFVEMDSTLQAKPRKDGRERYCDTCGEPALWRNRADPPEYFCCEDAVARQAQLDQELGLVGLTGEVLLQRRQASPRAGEYPHLIQTDGESEEDPCDTSS